MEIILLSDVVKLGDKDDVVSVRNGYALNYLIPQGLAKVATPAAKKMLAENQRQAAHRYERIKAEAQQQADLLGALSIQIPTLVGREGKIYGSVTPLQLSNVLREKGFEIDRRKILMPDEIKTVGTYSAFISLHKEVKAEIKFEVTEKES
jgi:large subunit ribosomal protein L9